MSPRVRLAAASSCFLVSGAAALLYEVVWLRLLGLAFGHTVHAVTLVLAAYMGGLAAGSLAAGPRAARIRRPLRAYAVMEAAIAAWALATPALFDRASAGYAALAARLEPGPAAAAALQLAVAALLLVPPTALMGATLPLLGTALARAKAASPSAIGLLYSVNTWGAVAGVIGTGFLLLPLVGVHATLWIGAVANLSVAAVALALDARTGSRDDADPGRSPEPEPCPARGGAKRLVLAATALSGATAMAYEVAWTRALSMVVGSSTYAFSAMLGTFLAGLALGAAGGARAVRRTRPGTAALAATQGLLALAALATLPLLGLLPEIALAILSWGGISHEGALAVQFAASGLVMIAPTTLCGAAFPLALHALTGSSGATARDVGRIYGWNTLGTIVGSVAAGFVLVPLLGIQGAVVLAAGGNLLASLVLLASPGGERGRRAAAATALVVAFGAASSLLPPWDHHLMTSGVAVYARSYLDEPGALRDPSRRGEVLFYEEGLHSTVAVLQSGVTRALTVNGKVDASNGADMLTQSLLGHLPALLAPEARRALVIGLGSGVTVAAVAAHPLDRIDVAEIEPAMASAARFFDVENERVLEDPRVRLLFGDGRRVLAAAAEPYDVIVSEPSNPWIAGVANLFSREFYEAARAKLAPGGVMVQWIQAYGLFPSELRTVVRTFQSVFPHVSVWRAERNDCLLVATAEPLELDLDALAARLASSPRLRRTFDRFQLEPEPLLLHHLLLLDDDARRYAGDAPLHTDDRPILEFAAPKALYAFTEGENLRLLRSHASYRRPPARGRGAAAIWSPEADLRASRYAWLRGEQSLARHTLERLGGELDPGQRIRRVELWLAMGDAGRARRELDALREEGAPESALRPWVDTASFLAGRETGAWVASGGDDQVTQVMLAAGAVSGNRAMIEVAAERLVASLQRAPMERRTLERLAQARRALGEESAAAALLAEVAALRARAIRSP